jgi:hypothetical protein
MDEMSSMWIGKHNTIVWSALHLDEWLIMTDNQLVVHSPLVGYLVHNQSTRVQNQGIVDERSTMISYSDLCGR